MRHISPLAIAVIALGALSACGSSDKTGGHASGPSVSTGSSPSGSSSSSGSTAGSAESQKSATAILADSTQAALAADTVHIQSNISTNPFDIDVSKSGQIKGSLVDKGQQMEVIVLNRVTAYGMTPKTNGQYVKLPAADASQVSDSLNKTALLTGGLTPTGSVTKAGTSTVQGTMAIGLRSSTGATLYITDDPAHPYPLDITSSKGQVTFTDWNAPVSIQAPAGG